MSYTTFAFLLFLSVVLMLRYHLRQSWQLPMLLLASYVFYMWAKPVFGLLLFLDTLWSYWTARMVQRQNTVRAKRWWLAAGVVPVFAVLFVFKYLNFFCESVLGLVGLELGRSLQLLLPVGVSFYTFSIAGYLFDVYRGKLEAERNVVTYGVFCAFFPSIMAGPINRARELLPQLKAPVRFEPEAVKRGLFRFLCGAGKKLIVADLLGLLVDGVYLNPAGYSGLTLIVAAAAYSLQIYFDFCAYSDMAIGVAKLLGFTLMENFYTPYLSRTIHDFWKKWHISLTSWFREYLYFPLGGSRKGTARTYVNILIVFAVSGLWHGAALTFLIWGLLNGLYQVVGKLTEPVRTKLQSKLHISVNNPVLVAWQILVTFVLASAAWIFFRADSLEQAGLIFCRIGTMAEGVGPLAAALLSKRQLALLLPSLLVLFWADGMNAIGWPMPELEKRPVLYWGAVCVIAVSILLFGAYGPGFNPQDFVYFKF